MKVCQTNQTFWDLFLKTDIKIVMKKHLFTVFIFMLFIRVYRGFFIFYSGIIMKLTKLCSFTQLAERLVFPKPVPIESGNASLVMRLVMRRIKFRPGTRFYFLDVLRSCSHGKSDAFGSLGWFTLLAVRMLASRHFLISQWPSANESPPAPLW